MNPTKFKDVLHTRYLEAKCNIFINRRYVTKQQEIEVCWLEKKIEDYGFNFFPEIYVVPYLEQLEAIKKQI